MVNTNDKDLWGALAFRGMLAILFGLAAVFWPSLTLVTLVYLFSAFIVASGLVSLVTGLIGLFGGDGSITGRGLSFLLGVLELGIGVYLLRHPTVAFATLILLIGAVLIVRGSVEAYSGLFEEEAATHKTVAVILGLISVIAGIVILLQPANAGVAFVWILGLYALITGPIIVALSYDLKKLK